MDINNFAEAGQPKAANPKVNLRFGIYNQPGDYSGKSVAEVRQLFGAAWGIPNEASAFKGKERLADDYILQPGDELEFHRRAGEKG